ncbi:aspartic protease [Moniliophthora roreri MCA 2997]|uniref:Aspartic protease n=2 Tax=Moniliophthora roreri TaxID=221103 RepID=V2XE42_MONRO|nr:aspartic protease [Moniliophthora roreri MCA 2997]
MRSFSSLLTALTLLQVVLGLSVPSRIGTKIPLKKRSDLVDEHGVINPDALKRQLIRAQSKLQRGIRAYGKNTGTVHSLAQKLTARNVGGVPLIAADRTLWYGSISVGTPSYEFTVDFDTGSSDLFLPGTNCNVNCAGHALYDPSASATSRDQGRDFSLKFGDGSTSKGKVFHDTVEVAGLTATEQAVGAATQYSDGFAVDQFPSDGLMGMAFPEISEFHENPVFQTLIAQGATTEPVFAFKLSASGSELTVGGIDNSLFSGQLTNIPVTTRGFWQVDLEAVSVDGNAVVNGLSSIIDTGTTLIMADNQSVAAFYAAIPGSKDASQTAGPGFFTVPCDSIPAISLTFGGEAFSISPDTFNLGRLSAESNDCVGGIAASKSVDFWVVGDVFLQNVYTVFNVGNAQVGFARLA